MPNSVFFHKQTIDDLKKDYPGIVFFVVPVPGC